MSSHSNTNVTDLLPVVIDTREQAGHMFTFPEKTVEISRATLPAGDYSLRGMEWQVTIERKTIGDLVNTVIGNWMRFRKKLNRMSGFDTAVIAVEGDAGQIWRHEYESEAEPNQVFGRINGIWFDHGIPVLFWGNRQIAQLEAHRFLLLAWRKYHE